MIEIKYMCSNGKEYNLVGDRMRSTSVTSMIMNGNQ